MLVGALAFSLVFVFSGFGNKMDPFFWMNKYEQLDTSLMSLGTVLVGHVWMLLFGRTIASLRVLGWLCCVVAIALPYVCLLDSVQRRAHLHWLAVAYIGMGYGVFQEFSSGCMSMLLLSALIVVWVKYLEGKNLLIPMAVLAGLATLVRLPNILALVFVFMLLLLLEYKQDHSQPKWLYRPLLFLLVSGTVVAIAYGAWMLWGTPEMSVPAGNHTLLKMLTKLVDNAWMLLAGMAVWGAIGWVLKQFGRLSSVVWQAVGAIVVAGLGMYYVSCAFTTTQWYNEAIHYFVASGVLALAVWLTVEAIVAKRWREALVISSSMLVMMVVPMGSDTGWLKLFPAVLCLLPWWAAQYSRWPGRGVMWMPVLVGVGCMLLSVYTHNSIGGCTTFGQKEWGDVDILRYTRIGPVQNERVRAVVADYAKYSRQGEVYMLGEDMHLFRALTHAPSPYKNEFWSNIYDPVYTKWYRELVKQKRPIFFVSYTPTFMLHKDTDKYKESKIEIMLREEGYRTVDRSEEKYMIYLPD